MRERFNKILALTLCLALSTSIMSPNFAAENDTSQTSPVKLTAQPIVFNVGVPTGLPVNVDAEGKVTVATDAKITNNSAAPIMIAGVQVNPITDWNIVVMNKDFKGTKIGTKEFGFVLNNDEVPSSGAMILTKANWPSVNRGSILPLSYNSVVAPQKDAIVGSKIADVVFTIGWDVNDFTLSFESLSIEKGSSSKLNLLGADSAIWTSSNETVANVDQSGNVTALDWGTTTITATTNGVSKTCEVTVPKIQTGLELNIASKSLKPNETVQLTATSKYRATTIWTSSNPTVATVNTSGLVTGKTAGTTAITATQGEFTATCTVTVNPAIGTKYTEGNYEYSYGQDFNFGSWENSGYNGWGVKVIDKTKTSYIQPLEEIQGLPVVSYVKLFSDYPNAVLTLEGTWTNKNVKQFDYMFSNGEAMSLNLNNFKTPMAIDIQGLFDRSKFTSIIGLNSLNTSNVQSMNRLFQNAKVLNIDVSGWNTSNVEDMGMMFCALQVSEIKGLNTLNTSKVRSMSEMFAYSSNLTSLDLSSFDTSNVTNMTSMFYYSQATIGYAKTQADANKFNTSSDKPSTLTFVVKPV